MSLLFRSTPFHLKQQSKLNKRSFSLSFRALTAGQQLSLAPPFTREVYYCKVLDAMFVLTSRLLAVRYHQGQKRPGALEHQVRTKSCIETSLTSLQRPRKGS